MKDRDDIIATLKSLGVVFITDKRRENSDYDMSSWRLDEFVDTSRCYSGVERQVTQANNPELLGKGDKPTNPKDAIGSDKLPLNLWPASATAMGCLGMLEGALKYGRTNWRDIGVRSSIYVDACKRHLDAWYEGEECAPDSGVPHLANALACLAIIIDAQATGKLNDDRNYKGGGYRPLIERLTPHVRRLKALFKGRDPKQYTIADNPSEGSCSSIS